MAEPPAPDPPDPFLRVPYPVKKYVVNKFYLRSKITYFFTATHNTGTKQEWINRVHCFLHNLAADYVVGFECRYYMEADNIGLHCHGLINFPKIMSHPALVALKKDFAKITGGFVDYFNPVRSRLHAITYIFKDSERMNEVVVPPYMYYKSPIPYC